MEYVRSRERRPMRSSCSPRRETVEDLTLGLCPFCIDMVAFFWVQKL